MKFIKEEIAGSDKTRYLFAVGTNESRILLSLLENAYIYMPKIMETLMVAATINNMKKIIEGAIKEMPYEKFRTRAKKEMKRTLKI